MLIPRTEPSLGPSLGPSRNGLASQQRISLALLFAYLIGLFALAALNVPGFAPLGAQAQIEAPDREFLFFEDKQKTKSDRERKKELERKQKKARQKQRDDLPFDINAPSINFDSAKNSVHAEGGLIISYGSTIIEAERGDFDVTTHDAELSGDVRLSDLTGDLLADSAKINLDSGAGTVINPNINFREGGFRVSAAQAEKMSKEEYRFTDASLTTCDCPDDADCRPWSIRGNEAEITQNGYGQVWGGSLAVHDVPVMYVPYLLFPAKTERQSGLLPATFGNSNNYGFELFAPLFLAIDRSTDATLTYVLQTKVRTGVESEFRKIFSKGNKLNSGLTYLDEAARDGDLLGTDLTGISDPTIKEQRFAGYLDGSFRGDVLGQQFQFIADGNYVNDNLILREFEQPEIGESNSRFVTSRAILRTDLIDTYSAELSSQYDQGLVDNQDVLLQELPSLDIVGLHVFRPFGENPLGAKMVLQNEFNSTNFYRDVGYDGGRHEFYENLKVPFHLQNYVDFEVGGDLRASFYDLNSREPVDSSTGTVTDGELLKANSDRLVPGINLKTSSVLEKVIDVSEGNIIKTLAELGTVGREEQLTRIKHTLEPTVKYRFVPEVDQDDNPQFDSNDKLVEKNVITYGLAQRLYGRFEGRDPYLYGIEETAPELSDIPDLQATGPVDEALNFGLTDPDSSNFRSLKGGSRDELANFGISQSFDVIEDQDNQNPDRNAFSDIGLLATLLPNEYFRVRGGTNVDLENSEFDSYGIETQLQDKRGDEIRARLSFVKDGYRQLESGIQFTLTDRLKLGYYTRYDDFTGDFLENKVGVRLLSRCNHCWALDVTLSDKTNPDETDILVTVTLLGLGEIKDKFFAGQFNNDQSNSNSSSP